MINTKVHRLNDMIHLQRHWDTVGLDYICVSGFRRQAICKRRDTSLTNVSGTLKNVGMIECISRSITDDESLRLRPPRITSKRKACQQPSDSDQVLRMRPENFLQSTTNNEYKCVRKTLLFLGVLWRRAPLLIGVASEKCSSLSLHFLAVSLNQRKKGCYILLR